MPVIYGLQLADKIMEELNLKIKITLITAFNPL
jgi:hypothetical protein